LPNCQGRVSRLPKAPRSGCGLDTRPGWATLPSSEAGRVRGCALCRSRVLWRAPGAPFMQSHRMSGHSRECANRFPSTNQHTSTSISHG